MITVNTNMASLIAQNSFNRASNSMNNALNRLSTGYRINSAKDDAAGSAIAAKLETKISSFAQATKNAEMGADYLQSADSTLSTMQSMVQRMRDLTEQAANGTYGADERKAIQAEIDGLTAELYRIKNTTEFNGKKILGEEEQPLPVQPNKMMSEITSIDDVENGTVIGISTAKDLLKLAEMTNAGQKTENLTFVLTNNIDLGSVDNFTAIGIQTKPFKGTFDGNGYTISNLTINKPIKFYQGLFGYVDSASLKNVNLENCKVDGAGAGDVGGLCGFAGDSVIVNCNVSGAVNGLSSLYTGGLIGRLEASSVDNCSANATATGDGEVGVFCGFAGAGSIIKNSTASGSAKSLKFGDAYAAGFVSSVEINALVENCASNVTTITGGFDGADSFVGAFCAWCEGEIRNCEYLNSAKLINNNDGSEIPFSACPTVDGTITNLVGSSNPKIKLQEPESISVKTNLQVGIQANENSVISIDTGFAMGNFSVNVVSDESARMSLKRIGALMDKITAKKTDIGASLNRLESVMAQQQTMRTSMTSALSQIKDADIARESAIYVKNQILQQTTASLLATANQNPNIALNLL